MAPINAKVERRDPRSVGKERCYESVDAARRAGNGKFNRERVRPVASLSIGCARLKRQPVFAWLALADDIHRIVCPVAVVQRATTRGTDVPGKLS